MESKTSLSDRLLKLNEEADALLQRMNDYLEYKKEGLPLEHDATKSL